MYKFSINRQKWRNYAVGFGLCAFAMLLIFGNFKSRSYYAKLKDAKKEIAQNSSRAQSINITPNASALNEKSIECDINRCSVTCSGDLTDLKTFLDSIKTCSSMSLRISDGIFPEKKLQSNWLAGTFNLSSIKIALTDLNEIQNGAFNYSTVAFLSELELDRVRIQDLNENTFLGLKAIETFTLVNEIDSFSGKEFLKPMMNSLKKVDIKHITNISTDPGPWLLGENFPKLKTIVFDGSNLGGFISSKTFEHLDVLSILMLNSCKITYIADGSFDFMMKQMVVLISLQNNLLKRIDGDYLSKVSSLKWLDIENNPWDCTCELEHLVRAFKKYPEGFGNKTKCSSPPDKAGKLLNEINLRKCESNPTTYITSTTSTTTALSTTTLSTTMLSTKASSTSVETTTENITPNRCTDSSKFTELSVANVTEKERRTPAIQNRSTTASSDCIYIECGTRQSNIIAIPAPDVYFTISTINEKSVKLVFKEHVEDFQIIWFYEQPYPSNIESSVGYVKNLDICCQSGLNETLVVEDLDAHRSYIFCLIRYGDPVITPFNCQSHSNAANDNIWLGRDQKSLVIGMFVACILVALCFGSIGMFLLVLYYPTLLKGNKRIIVVNKNAFQDNFVRNMQNSVTESSFGQSYNSEATTADLRRYSCESGFSYMMAHNYEDLEYRWRMNANNDLASSNRVPISRPPPLPTRVQVQRTSDLPIIPSRDTRCNDYGYTSVS